jgi:phosphoribosyl-ATP pyrophosphohydrolase
MNIKIPKPFKNKTYKSRHNKVLDKKKQSVIMDIEAKGHKEVKTEAGNVVFDQGIAVLEDDSRADEIHAELQEKHQIHPDQYSYVRHREGMKRSEIHNYTFGQWPQMPWKKDK